MYHPPIASLESVLTPIDSTRKRFSDGIINHGLQISAAQASGHDVFPSGLSGKPNELNKAELARLKSAVGLAQKQNEGERLRREYSNISDNMPAKPDPLSGAQEKESSFLDWKEPVVR
jgi:hypothetical protein